LYHISFTQRLKDKLCSECSERIAIRDCNECGDKFCTKCYKALHTTGMIVIVMMIMFDGDEDDDDSGGDNDNDDYDDNCDIDDYDDCVVDDCCLVIIWFILSTINININ